MIVREITDFLESIAPLELQESYDNAGLIVGDKDMEVTGVLCCLDSTETIVDEAITKGCNLIVAHHPIVFSGLKRITGSNYIERTVIKAIKRGIAIYAIHTNLDNVLQEGVSQKMAEKIGLHNIGILHKKESILNKEVGLGAIGSLGKTLTERQFASFVKDRFQLQCLRHTPFLGKDITTVAVCGGSGSFLLDKALAEGADVLITADFKYHQFFDADGKIVVFDIGHYESEVHTIGHLHDLIRNNFPNFAVYFTERSTNPVHYY